MRHVLVFVMVTAISSPAFSQARKPVRKAPPAPAAAALKKGAPEMTCPAPLGVGVKTRLTFCEVMAGRDPAGGVVIQVPPHKGPATLTFDLHNLHTYSDEQVKAHRAYTRYTATIGVLTLDNTLLSRAVVQNEFRAAADLVDRVGDRDAVGVLEPQNVLLGIHASPDAGAGEAVTEARTFLVSPVDQFDRRLGCDAEVVQAAHDLKPGENAQGAVVLAAGGLAVEVGPEQHRQPCGVAAGAASEHVADGVDPDGQAQGLALGAKAVTTGFVDRRQSEAPHTALGRGTDLGEAHERVPQTPGIDALVGL